MGRLYFCGKKLSRVLAFFVNVSAIYEVFLKIVKVFVIHEKISNNFQKFSKLYDIRREGKTEIYPPFSFYSIVFKKIIREKIVIRVRNLRSLKNSRKLKSRTLLTASALKVPKTMLGYFLSIFGRLYTQQKFVSYR